MAKKVLVIAAHIGDFVWRCGGTIAKHTSQGDIVNLIVLTFGARGETNSYWKEASPTLEECKKIRYTEGTTAAKILGISHVIIEDYVDYPLFLDLKRLEKLAKQIREFAPDIILTHDNMCDPYNHDHTLVGEKIYEAVAMACAAGVYLEGVPHVPKPVVYGYEPHVSEISRFYPDIYIDISDVEGIKEEAMSAYKTQANMLPNYINRGIIRSKQSKIKGCLFAEAFSKKI